MGDGLHQAGSEHALAHPSSMAGSRSSLEGKRMPQLGYGSHWRVQEPELGWQTGLDRSAVSLSMCVDTSGGVCQTWLGSSTN